MTGLQKLSSIVLSLCLFLVLLLIPGTFFLREYSYPQLPLYFFLKNEAGKISQREDPETYELIIESNAAYLGEKVREENAAEIVKKEITAETKDVAADTEKITDTRIAEQEKTAEIEVQAGDGSDEAEMPSVQDNPSSQSASARIQPVPNIELSPEILADYDYLMNQFFILDSNAVTSEEQLNAARFLNTDLTVSKDASVPQILIYHSHSQEAFMDSREGVEEDTIVGVGAYLAKILMENYGYQVIHVKESFDLVNGVSDRSKAYDYARVYIEKVLAENPTIEVVIDLHRDGVPEDRHLATTINGKETAQIMFYNGLSYTKNGPVEYLPNPYIQENLAFSFQLEYQAAQYYPEFYRGIYLAGLRYNLHLKPRALLLEAGAQTNTVQEVKNAMEPFADILNRVLDGE